MTVEIHGTVADGFEKVADAFAQNFADGVEVGAACAVRVGGEEVVDLWAGVADPATGRPYEADTLQLVFSSTKGVVSIAVHQLAEQGLIDLDAPMATYWPEFAANGKEHITVRHVLTHRSGVVGIDRVLTVEEFCAWDPFVEALAAAAPLWDPDTAHGYHAISFGHLLGEVIRRVTGTDVGTYVREHVAGPVGAEFVIGATDAEIARIAPLLDFAPGALDEPDPTIAAIFDIGSPTSRAFMIAPVFPTTFNQPELLRAQVPSANGCTSARSLARIYGGLVSEVEGARLLGREQLDDARAPPVSGRRPGDHRGTERDRLRVLPARRRLAPAGRGVVRSQRPRRFLGLRLARARDRLRLRHEPDDRPDQGRPPHPSPHGRRAGLHRMTAEAR